MASSVALFTMEYIVSIGGKNDQETQYVISTLNTMTDLWGNEAIQCMQKFMNLVKSKTDELSVALRSDAPRGGVSARTKASESDKAKETSQSDAKIVELETELDRWKGMYRELEKKTRVPIEKTQLVSFAATYTKRCIELDEVRDSSTRHAFWYNDQVVQLSSAKLELEKKVAAKETQITKLLKEKESGASIPAPIRDVIKGLQRPPFEGNTNCLIPTREGQLVPLEYVYSSWKKIRLVASKDLPFPDFKIPPAYEYDFPADPRQITMVTRILSGLGLPYTPPFNIQYKLKQEDENWTDVDLADQMTIASIMYHMSHHKLDPPVKVTERRVIQDVLLATVSMGVDAKLEINIRTIGEEPMGIIPSRIVVNDSALMP